MRLAFLLVVVLNGFAITAYAQSARSALSDLPLAVRDDIARVCLPVQYRDGAAAYRTCVKDEIASREQVNPVTKAQDLRDLTTNLSFDDRYAIQQACQSNAQDSLACTKKQIQALTALPTPDLDQLTTDEHYVMQQTCFNAQSTQGAAAYRQCQLSEIQSVVAIAAPDFSGLNSVDRNALQLRCSANSSNVADYRNCLRKGASNDVNTNTTVAANAVAKSTQAVTQPAQSAPSSTATQVVTVRPATNQSDTSEAGITNRASTRPRLILPPSDNGDISTVEAIEPAADAVAVTRPEPELPTPAATVLNDDANVVAVSASADVVQAIAPEPVIEVESFDAQSESNSDTETTTDAQSNTSNADTTPEATEATGASDLGAQLIERFTAFRTSAVESFLNLSQQGKLLLGALVAMPIALWVLLRGRGRRRRNRDYDDSEYSRQDLRRRVHSSVIDDDDHDPISASWAEEADTLFEDTPTIKVDRPVEATNKPIYNKPAPGMAGWLQSQPKEDQQSLAIEFLVYWMAYGDERYEPSLKHRIFQDRDPSVHDIVKRWVLKEDIHAFADVVEWLQRNTTNVQKEQIVRMLMALLINGNSPTPVQITLLRFLSDVFYLDKPNLDELFEADFGMTLPAIARVDRMAWWQRQAPGSVALWDARALNASDQITRYAAQLGVDGEARAEHVEAAYERSVARCDSSRFDHLGQREHQLLAGRCARLVEARDELLEALV